MAIRNIIKKGDHGLREESITVKRFDKNLAKLLDDMAETMYDAPGCGLAAPQIGINKRIIVVDVQEESGLIEMVNPEITEYSGEEVDMEGCLSIPGVNGYVNRFYQITVAFQTRSGEHCVMEAEGYLARALQHEIDHLHGILFTDILTEAPEWADDSDLE